MEVTSFLVGISGSVRSFSFLGHLRGCSETRHRHLLLCRERRDMEDGPLSREHDELTRIIRRVREGKNK